MGYFIQKIAEESVTPVIVSLSSNPNYIEFKSNSVGENKPVEVNLTIKGTGFVAVSIDEFTNISAFKIIEIGSGVEHIFKGTTNINEIDTETFYLGKMQNNGWPPIPNYGAVAENLKACLMKNPFLKSNFEITLPPNDYINLGSGTTISIKSKGSGKDFAFKIIPDDIQFGEYFITIEGDPEETTNYDSIAENNNSVEIQLEVYKNTGVFLGENDKPNNNNMGTLVTSLTKAYALSPLWFNINVLKGDFHSNNFLEADSWCDAGTIQDFRFSAKRFISNSERYDNTVFYFSNVLYSICGFKRNLEQNDLLEYIYSTVENNIVKPLTTQPILFHINGQTQYFNFILSDPDRNKNLAEEYKLGICYRLYTQSRRFIADVHAHSLDRKQFNIVNTLKLDIDGAIGDYNNIGFVEVYLCRLYPDIDTPITISEPISFSILPECLYKVNDFAFLNPLGGWSSFNFSGSESTDFKTKENTIFKTQKPNYTISSEIESVYSKEIDEQFTAQTMPVTREICNYLKELSSSIAVYELSTKRYVIVEEMNIKPNSKDELFRVEMKYRYSDAYNALIK